MKMNKINLGRLNVSSLSERELNSVFGGQVPITTAPVGTVVTQSGHGITRSSTGADQDVTGDSDTDVIDEHISF